MESLDNGNLSTGATLAAAREAAGMSLIDVARETRVPLRHLKALEADDHADLPALPYASGFVKSYALAVGLDSAVMAAQFRSETSKTPHVPTPLALEPLDERRMPSRSLALGSVLVVGLVIAGLSAWGAGMFDPPLPAASEVAAADTASVESPDPVAAGGSTADASGADLAAAPATPPGDAAAALPAATATGPVVLKAREDVWLKIYDPVTKAVARIGVMPAGESYTVPADQPGLKLWTGKAGAFDVTVGGRPIPPLGGAVEGVRDLSLAPGDLVARTAPAAAAATAPADAAAGAAPSAMRPIAQVPRPRPATGAADTPPATPGV